ncbi:hypothetical protein BJV77DRAFT_1011664 [Russula vinacea]|nr:hypothetical protein BJV77DRAFT_1011664 [Russula vinacea]
MRFTKWPAFTNALVIFTITLSSLIPAANATGPVANVNFLIPKNGATYNAGDESGITWTYDMNANTSEEILLGDVCNLYLVNGNTGSRYTLETGVPLLDSSGSPDASSVVNPDLIPYPVDATAGGGYFVLMESDTIGNWRSDIFSIAPTKKS